MSEPIFSSDYWKGRLADAIAREQIQYAIYHTNSDTWEAIAKQHKKILNRVLAADTSVFDAGCGWGRLLTLVPSWWKGDYLGVDLSPDFIDMARLANSGMPYRRFMTHDLRRSVPQLWTSPNGVSSLPPIRYDLGVCISIKPMVIANCGGDEWMKMEEVIRSMCKHILYLEYDPEDNGELVASYGDGS